MTNEVMNSDEDVEIIVDDGVEQSNNSHFAGPLTVVDEGDRETNGNLSLYFIHRTSMSIFSKSENI